MPDYRSYYDKDFIGAWDLNDGDKTITITKCIGGSLTAPGGRKSKKPVVYFQGSDKGFALNATNGKTIASLYGNMVENWPGKRITLYKSMTRSPQGDGDVECIRVRPTVPTGAHQKPAPQGGESARTAEDSSPSPSPAVAGPVRTRMDTLLPLCDQAGLALDDMLAKAEVSHPDEMSDEDYDSLLAMLRKRILRKTGERFADQAQP